MAQLVQVIGISLAVAHVSLNSMVAVALPNKLFQIAQLYNPPTPPGSDVSGRNGVGTGKGGCFDTPLTLKALVPQQGQMVWGQTTVDHPSIWIYMPYAQASGLSVEFYLEDRAGNKVYSPSLKDISLPEKPGVMELKIPRTTSPLQDGKLYFWYLAIKECDPKMEVFGWIQKVRPSAPLSSQIRSVSPAEQAKLYAANGIWFDAVTVLGNQLKYHPQDQSTKMLWNQLLSEAQLVNLKDPKIEEQPLVK